MESDLDVSWKLKAIAAVVLPSIIFLFFVKKWKKPKAIKVEVPPGPKKLPIIGNLHQIHLPHFRCFGELAKQYGPIMQLRMGGFDAIIITSPEIAKEVLKDKDPIFTDKPQSTALKILWYNFINLALSPYGEYWRQIRKICVVEILSNKSVRSMGSIREDEVSRLVDSLRLSAGEPVNMTEKVFSALSSVICRAAFGKVVNDKQTLIRLVREGLEMGTGSLLADIFPSSKIASALSWGTKRKLVRMRRKLDLILDDIIREHETNRASDRMANGELGNEDLVDVLLRVKDSGELHFPIGYDNIKAILFDMFAGGTETSSSTIDWAMTELMRNPRVMAKAQAEVRQMVKQKGENSIIEQADISKLNYLKLVFMETLRLHPQGAIIRRVSREAAQISGYDVPEKMMLLVNAWAIHRDPKYWPDPETFQPERFENQTSFDFTGTDFRYVPFGSGKRVCPGIAFSTTSVGLPLAHILYNFNWELPPGVNPQDLDMIESTGLSSSRKQNLFVVATPYQP